MKRKPRSLLLVALLVLLLSGMTGCRRQYLRRCYEDGGPKDLFSWIDRHCFVADWMNDHSCLSCRHCSNNTPPELSSTRVYTADTDPVPDSASK
jgi:hypothetical protein